MNSEFTFHLLNDTGKTKAMKIATSFNTLLEDLKETCAPGREFSIVKTKLEEACFFAKKSMAGHADNHAEVNPDLLKS